MNLQGIKFDTKDGGVLPLAKYLEATLHRPFDLENIATERGLNAKYLRSLWNALNDSKSTLVLDPIRTKWRAAKRGDADTLLQSIATWQQALWRFTQVGHLFME